MIRGFSLVLRIHDYHSLILSIIDQSILYVIENVFVSIKDGFTLLSGPLQRDATVSKFVLNIPSSTGFLFWRHRHRGFGVCLE